MAIFRRGDLLIAGGFALVAALLSVIGQRRLDPVLFEYGVTSPDSTGLYTSNIWFDGDLPKIRVLANDRFADYGAFSAKHPGYWPAAFAANKILEAVGLGWLDRLRVITALLAASWGAAFFLLLRRLTGRPLDASILTALGLSSATATFWFAVPEVFLPGSVTVIATLLLVAIAETNPVGAVAFALAGTATLAVTVTNWMVAVLGACFSVPRRAAVASALGGLALMSLLWGAQRPWIPASRYFLLPNAADRKFILSPASGGPGRVAASFLAHSMVMPAIEELSATKPAWRGLSVQRSTPGSGNGPVGVAALVLWGTTLAIGGIGLVRGPDQRPLRATIGLTLGLQLALHLAYGTETFLFSMHFLPLLVATAACGSLTRFRAPFLVLVVALTVLGAANNWRAFDGAAATVAKIGIDARSTR